MKTYAFRVHPGDDPMVALDAVIADRLWPAACIVSAVGSLTRAAIRFADEPDTTLLDGPFEILSLVGTLSPAGHHIHISIGDGAGQVLGGHLMEGSTVYTTAEIVIGILDGWIFDRQIDPETGYDELIVEQRE